LKNGGLYGVRRTKLKEEKIEKRGKKKEIGIWEIFLYLRNCVC
jgi:hypothetical protein